MSEREKEVEINKVPEGILIPVENRSHCLRILSEFSERTESDAVTSERKKEKEAKKYNKEEKERKRERKRKLCV